MVVVSLAIDGVVSEQSVRMAHGRVQEVCRRLGQSPRTGDASSAAHDTHSQLLSIPVLELGGGAAWRAHSEVDP